MTELKLTMTEKPMPGGRFIFDFQMQRVETDDATGREKLVMRGLSDHIERAIREAEAGKEKKGLDWGWVFVALAAGAALCAIT